MPGTTPLGLRYPLQGETVDATSWQNLANDVDALMTTINNLRTTAFHPQTASVGNLGSDTLPVTTATGVVGIMLYNKVNWDTFGGVNLGVNNDRITVGPGIWWVRSTVSLLDSWTTLTYMRAGIDAPAGTNFGLNQVDTVLAPTLAGPVTTNALIALTAPATAVTMPVIWVGTGGPARWGHSTASLQVIKIRDLFNV